MTRGRGRDIDGIDICVVDQVFNARMHPRDAMPAGIIVGFRAIASHDRDERRTIGLLKGRSAFHLGDVAAADHAPPYALHGTRSYPTALEAEDQRGRLQSICPALEVGALQERGEAGDLGVELSAKLGIARPLLDEANVHV